MRFAATVAVMLAALSATAEASDTKAKGKAEENLAYVAISPVAIPVIVNGKVVNYVFVNVRIDLTNSANAVKLREREPYFRDALVRAAHRTPFTLASDLTKIDEGKLKTAVYRDAVAIAGPNAIKGVSITSQAPKSMRVGAR
jgi:flagellar basal body-associated protein FliL